jgi:hypothetical protein
MPKSIDKLKIRIKHEVQQLDQDMITRACRDSLRSRLERLLLKAGGYIE